MSPTTGMIELRPRNDGRGLISNDRTCGVSAFDANSIFSNPGWRAWIKSCDRTWSCEFSSRDKAIAGLSAFKGKPVMVIEPGTASPLIAQAVARLGQMRDPQ